MEVWRPGKTGADCVKPAMTLDELPTFFEQHKHELSPRRLYEAKARGRLPDGSRVNVAVRPIAVDGALVSIRKFSKKK